MTYRRALIVAAAMLLLAVGLQADPIQRYKKDDLSKLGDHSTILVLRIRLTNTSGIGIGYSGLRYLAKFNAEYFSDIPWKQLTRLPCDDKNTYDEVLYAKVVPGRYDLRGYEGDISDWNKTYHNMLCFDRTAIIPADSLVVGQVKLDITSFDRRRYSFTYNADFSLSESDGAMLLNSFAAKFPATATQFKGRETALNSFPLVPWPLPAAVYQRDFSAGPAEWSLTDDAGRAVICDTNGYIVASPDTLRGVGWAKLPVENLGQYYSVELCTRWLSGGNGVYGLIMGDDSMDFHLLGITSSGEAGTWYSWKGFGCSKPEFGNSSPRRLLAGVATKSTADNVITVQVRGKETTWFVNGRFVWRYKDDFGLSAKTLGLVVYGPQRVAFKWLKVAKW